MRQSKESTTMPERKMLTPEGREEQLIHLAVNLAEKQLREGTASSQVITHYLKLGTRKEKLENEILEQQRKLVEAKIETLESSKRMGELYADALKAMRSYYNSGDSDE